ncbi:DUF1972 domain-containing protein [Empedobacter brevis]|uniref:DUF1972 domain-containing protein n=1 Tax=Empedobacter brevis TaxID=247 RepID=A0AAJ1VA30_9FLAO|nr:MULTISPECIES: DUF1972 domain-containing protein [Empedobacter]MDM1073370.1 DUF1972 domain-containing protein [Empedobacter brevis]QHC83779.1 glycosyl transferase family 1 [Empedobacter brevis]
MTKIAIFGTRGIPNYHGGFEQFAEFFAVYLANKGEDVYVYNSSIHPYKEQTYNGVKLIHCKDPEDKMGTPGQFIYDLNCILDARKRNFDVILQLGYTSSTIWWWLMPKTAKIITNMDGLEWKRSKYSKKVQHFLKYAEKLGAKHSDHLVADSLGIQSYLRNKYNKASTYIAYGADVFTTPDESILNKYQIKKGEYSLLIARFEPENNLEMILDGVSISSKKETFLVIGKHETAYGEFLKNKYKAFSNIIFTGGIYNFEELNNIRYYSRLYFHGHSVGGTNPSLLEAMASNCLICANDNQFNKGVLKKNAFYFSDSKDVNQLYTHLEKENELEKIHQNINAIQNEFSWEIINEKYYELIKQ